MATIKLGERPKNFKKTVEFHMLDGTEGAIQCTFKYRTRKEFGEFQDDWRKRREAKNEAEVQAKVDAYEARVEEAKKAGQPMPSPTIVSQGDFQAAVVEASAEYLMEILDDWNLDVGFSESTVQQLCDELPGAHAAITEAYRVAIVEGRLKN